MGFIDKKKRVIDFNLTDYGRELLSKGILEFDHFAVSDFEVQYLSSSEDFSIEIIPIFEAVSSYDPFSNRIIDSEVFKQQYPKVSIGTGSLAIKRTTDDNFKNDYVLNIITAIDSVTPQKGVVSRVESLKNKGYISDLSSSISSNRSYTTKTPRFVVTIESSSSFGKSYLLASGTSFGLSDDNVSKYNLSTEKNISETFYEIIKIT